MKILRRIWDRWLVVGKIIGDFIARIVLTFFYFTIFMPFGIGLRILGDPLDIKNPRPEWLNIPTDLKK